MKKNNAGEVLKVIFIIIGAVVSIGALIAVVYTVFKKYFQVTFECDGNCCDCGEDCFGDEDESFEPVCTCEDDEEAETEDSADAVADAADAE